jgi:hypothetical protein
MRLSSGLNTNTRSRLSTYEIRPLAFIHYVY